MDTYGDSRSAINPRPSAFVFAPRRPQRGGDLPLLNHGTALTYSFVFDDLGRLVLGLLPKSESVKPRITLSYDASGVLLRRREADYDAKGRMTELRQYFDGSGCMRHEISYDAYGNLSSMTDPRGQRSAWTYDSELHQYPTETTVDNAVMSGPAYTTASTFDPRFGVPLRQWDANGLMMEYHYDGKGRLIWVRTPYDTGALPAVSYDYDASTFPWSVMTTNKLSHDPLDPGTIRTAIAVDGLGRPLYTAKTGETRNALGERTIGWNVSGAVRYDAFGRQVESGVPVFQWRPCQVSVPACRPPPDNVCFRPSFPVRVKKTETAPLYPFSAR